MEVKMTDKKVFEINIGDWEQDTGFVRVLLEGCLLKLLFQLHKSEERGVFTANIRAISILFKTNIEESRELLAEISENNLLNIEEIAPDKFCIKSRRMVREGNISTKRVEARLSYLTKPLSKPSTKPLTNPQTNPQQKWGFVKDDNISLYIKEVVELLNKKSGKNFSLKTTKTKDLIKARFNEGFTKEDFEKVISQKCNEWLDDAKMVLYLRPETLFGNKFEGYLQSIPKNKIVSLSTIPLSDEQNRINLETYGNDPRRKVKSVYGND
jgi:uncharacterized phage protein (TIGR02220 family)